MVAHSGTTSRWCFFIIVHRHSHDASMRRAPRFGPSHSGGIIDAENLHDNEINKMPSAPVTFLGCVNSCNHFSMTTVDVLLQRRDPVERNSPTKTAVAQRMVTIGSPDRHP
jgi:hypothetical protein